MSDRPKSANQRRLEQLRAVRDDALAGPTQEEEIDALQDRIVELEAEVDRLRQLLQATRPSPENTSGDATTGSAETNPTSTQI